MTYHDMAMDSLRQAERDLLAIPEVRSAVARMREWAHLHPECDTQGIMDDEWVGLAGAAFGLADTRTDIQAATRWADEATHQAVKRNESEVEAQRLRDVLSLIQATLREALRDE